MAPRRLRGIQLLLVDLGDRSSMVTKFGPRASSTMRIRSCHYDRVRVWSSLTMSLDMSIHGSERP
jgi:hypothetical protein